MKKVQLIDRALAKKRQQAVRNNRLGLPADSGSDEADARSSDHSADAEDGDDPGPDQGGLSLTHAVLLIHKGFLDFVLHWSFEN